jgi:hypothetical protein
MALPQRILPLIDDLEQRRLRQGKSRPQFEDEWQCAER